MEENNEILELATKNYSPDEPSPFENRWYNNGTKKTHKKVKAWLKNKVNEKTLILNAGSGGSNYGINDVSMVHLDIVDKLINMHENYLVASIDCIPCEDNSFDVVICVGSVLNYADITLAIKELSRVLKPSGTLILEFERSNSAEFLFTKKHHKNVVLCDEQYGSQRHKFWLYGEKFVLELLENYKMKCTKKYRFHVISSLVSRITKTENFPARFTFLDSCFKPLSYPLASNIMLHLIKCENTT